MAYSVVNDVLLLETLSCAEIDDMLVLQCAPALRRNLLERGLLDLDAMDSDVFHRLFRFRKMDLPDLLSSLLIPEEFVSAQRVRVPGNEALCMTLRRLSYPNRLCELELLFNRHSSVISSVVSTVLAHMEYHFNHLLADLTKHRWLNLIALENFSEVSCTRKTVNTINVSDVGNFIEMRTTLPKSVERLSVEVKFANRCRLVYVRLFPN